MVETPEIHGLQQWFEGFEHDRQATGAHEVDDLVRDGAEDGQYLPSAASIAASMVLKRGPARAGSSRLPRRRPNSKRGVCGVGALRKEVASCAAAPIPQSVSGIPRAWPDERGLRV